MSSQVAVCNMALIKLGEQQIISITENTKAARLLLGMFDIQRDAELRKRRWSFSIARAQLASDVTDPVFGYTAQFTLPVDCLRVIQVGDYLPGGEQVEYLNMADAEPYRIEGRKILTRDEGPLNIRYIKRIEDTSQWDSAFTEAFACRLAWQLAEPLTADAGKKNAAWQEYTEAVREAARANAIELPPRNIAADTWETARTRN